MLYSNIYNAVKNGVEEKNLAEINDEYISRNKLNKLLKRFAIQYMWDNDEICLYCYDYICCYIRVKNDIGYEYSIFELFKLIQNKHLEKNNVDDDLISFEKEVNKNLYKSSLFLKNKGFNIKINEGVVSEESINEIFINIEKLIKNMGVFFVRRLLIEIDRYKKSYGLYHIPIDNKDQTPPYGILLSLGFKHYNLIPLSSGNFEKDYRSIIELSIHLTNLLNLCIDEQNYELMYSDGENIIQETQRLVLLDSIYRFNQYKSEHVLYFLSKVLEEVSSEYIDLSVKKKVNIIFDIFKFIHKQKETTFEISSFIKLFKKYDTQDVFDAILYISHVDNCNANYNNIYDFNNLNYYDKPFILNYSGSKQCINYLNSALFSIGFYNCIMRLLRSETNIDIDSKMGGWLEKIVSMELIDLGLNVVGVNKKYNLDKSQKEKLAIGSDNLETDLIIEFDDRICFIEIKKKALKKESKSGEYFSILEDLMKSLVKSQIQAFRHERFLRTYNEISFTDNEIIKLNNREIITVSLSNFNYGSLHDYSFTSKVLDILGAGFLNDNEYKDRKKIDDFNKSLKQLHKEVELKYCKYENMKFSRCHFLNIFHLFFLIDLCKTNKEKNPSYIFKKAMDDKRIYTPIFDFYFEFNFLLSIWDQTKCRQANCDTPIALVCNEC